MPLPTTEIQTLGDHFGQYTICVRCRQCQHYCEILPADLARISKRKWQTPFAAAVQALFCAECNARDMDIEIGFDAKPRGWVRLK